MNFSKLIFLFMLCWKFVFPGEIYFFTENPNSNNYYEYSRGSDAGNSYVEMAGPSNDKFPVDSDHPHQGFHALRLQWRSSTLGDWEIGVASYQWTVHDLTQYDSIQYWINAPQAIAAADLPDLALEDANNHKSTRVGLGNFLAGIDADTTTWQKVSIPINAFSPGPQNCDFTRIKFIFHLQKQLDNVTHTVWIDEVKAIGPGGGSPPGRPTGLTATGYDSRIDLKWIPGNNPDLLGYYVYRSSTAGTFNRINAFPHSVHIYSDFFGQNNQTHSYYITAVNRNFQESPPSDTVSATSSAMTTEELITSVQEATFRYFLDHAHPISGMARERKGSGDVCATGGTGFGLMAMVVGVERGFVSRGFAAGRVLQILRFLQDNATRYHGAWSHWINGATGATIPFSQFDDGGDLVETAYLVQGLLTVRQYFDRNNATESAIRQRATQMWEGVDWNWYRKDPPEDVLYWHWSPNYGWQMNLPIRGFNETMIVYLLAIASPTHPVPALLYHTGWAGGNYVNGNSFYGYMQQVGPDYGGPLFFTHYSYMGFDPRNKADQYANYFENNRNISLIHREYCIDNPFNYAGYDSLVWGLTASDNPWGYSAHAPMSNDNGTITPTAALSAMPYTPQESIATLEHFYHALGQDLWGEFGFHDAFNLDQNWFADSYIAIDQGPIMVMIENYRTKLCWNLFMSNPEIPAMLDSIGFVTGIDDPFQPAIHTYQLHQNYPNPFNSETVIQFSLAKTGQVKLEVYNLLGQRVETIYENQVLSAGSHEVSFDANTLRSGFYFYRLQTEEFTDTKKMLLVR